MSDAGWTLTSHACRHCLGRLLERAGVFMCADCEIEAHGKPDAICGCGMRIEAAQSRTRTKDVFRCGPNPLRSHNSPAKIVILFGDTPAVPIGGV